VTVTIRVALLLLHRLKGRRDVEEFWYGEGLLQQKMERVPSRREPNLVTLVVEAIESSKRGPWSACD